MNPMEAVQGVVETRSWLAKFKSAWAIPHLHTIGRKATKFQMNSMNWLLGLGLTAR